MNVVAAGDCGVDRYLNLRADRPGGISLNFAVNARARFRPDAHVGVVTALGEDREADVVRAAFHTFDIAAVAPAVPGATPIQYIDRQPSGEKIFVRYEPGILASHQIGDPGRVAIANSDVMITALFPGVVGFIDSVMAAPSRGLRAVDFGALSGFDQPLQMVDRYVDRLDVGFFGLTASEDALIDALDEIAGKTKRLFIITLAAEGGLALDGGRRQSYAAVPVEKVVDTTGAGDTFAAGFLSEYAYSREVSASLERGARAAADAVTRMGAFEAAATPWT